MKLFIEPDRSEWTSLLQRPAIDHSALEMRVASILEEVRQQGDAAVKKYTAQFDGTALNDLRVSEAEFEEAGLLLSDALKSAVELAKKNISVFHEAQKEISRPVQTTKGVLTWRKAVAIQKVGLYIPGGTAPLFSTLLMLGIPAKLAGCEEIVVCTPADKNGKIHPAILYVAQQIGLNKVYKIGGVQAIGAMAYGTASVPRVYKIFGPGNQYVTAAKQHISREGIAIDMPAGPSEVAVYADETAHPAFVAADLLSQAEHGADSQVVLVATTQELADQIKKEVYLQLAALPRKDIALKSLENSSIVIMPKVPDAFDLLNEYAAEHLILASDKAEELAALVLNAGSVFLGHYSPESAGDYASGTNHTLPTNGYAKAYSGVSLDSFVKKITFQHLNKEGIKSIGTAVETMAAAEGLDAHKYAVTVRLNSL